MGEDSLARLLYDLCLLFVNKKFVIFESSINTEVINEKLMYAASQNDELCLDRCDAKSRNLKFDPVSSDPLFCYLDRLIDSLFK